MIQKRLFLLILLPGLLLAVGGCALTSASSKVAKEAVTGDAIHQGRVKTASYVVKGKTYVPMSVKEAQRYREEGIASWYGYESGRVTANGEVFDPNGFTAAHKYLPIPTFVRVTNLENGKFIIARVNDRGPFPSIYNPRSGDRIIDVSMGAAKHLGFYARGTTRVRVEAIPVQEVRAAWREAESLPR
jgi:rare lipoprotein A